MCDQAAQLADIRDRLDRIEGQIETHTGALALYRLVWQAEGTVLGIGGRGSLELVMPDTDEHDDE